MKKNKKNFLIFTLLIILVLIMSFMTKHFPNYTLVIIATNLLLLTALSYTMFGFKKNIITIFSKQIISYLLICFLIYYIIIYCLGLVIGYHSNDFFKANFITILFYFLNIIFLETIRYIIIHKDKDTRFTLPVITIFMILINSLLLQNLVQINFLIFLSIIINNIFLTYLSYYFGNKVVLIYHLFLEGFLLFLPIVPKVSSTSFSLFTILIIIIIYFGLNRKYIKYEQTNHKSNFVTKRYRLIYLPFFFLVCLVLILVSKSTNIYLMGIASNSMSPKLKRGDAIIVNKVSSEDELSVKDIIVFKHHNRKIIHRIVKIITIDDKKVYLTKGDNNKNPDNVTLNINEIEGKVTIKIPYLAYPAIKAREIINKGKEG